MNKLLTLGVVTLAAAGTIGLATVNAAPMNGQGTAVGIGQSQGQGYGYASSLESRAQVLGMTVVDLERALQTKTMSQIAVERGMSEDTFRAKMTEAAKTRWEAHGLSDQEIAQRIADREQRQAENQADHEFGSGDGQHRGGYGQNH